VVVPLIRASAIARISHASFNPEFKIRGAAVVLHPLEIVSVPIDQLGDLMGTLSNESPNILAALDEPLTRAWKQIRFISSLPLKHRRVLSSPARNQAQRVSATLK
jgi:hypothetical protein